MQIWFSGHAVRSWFHASLPQEYTLKRSYAPPKRWTLNYLSLPSSTDWRSKTRVWSSWSLRTVTRICKYKQSSWHHQPSSKESATAPITCRRRSPIIPANAKVSICLGQRWSSKSVQLRLFHRASTRQRGTVQLTNRPKLLRSSSKRWWKILPWRRWAAQTVLCTELILFHNL